MHPKMLLAAIFSSRNVPDSQTSKKQGMNIPAVQAKE
jgi:hypothetical protein